MTTNPTLIYKFPQVTRTGTWVMMLCEWREIPTETWMGTTGCWSRKLKCNFSFVTSPMHLPLSFLAVDNEMATSGNWALLCDLFQIDGVALSFMATIPIKMGRKSKSFIVYFLLHGLPFTLGHLISFNKVFLAWTREGWAWLKQKTKTLIENEYIWTKPFFSTF